MNSSNVIIPSLKTIATCKVLQLRKEKKYPFSLRRVLPQELYEEIEEIWANRKDQCNPAIPKLSLMSYLSRNFSPIPHSDYLRLLWLALTLNDVPALNYFASGGDWGFISALLLVENISIEERWSLVNRMIFYCIKSGRKIFSRCSIDDSHEHNIKRYNILRSCKEIPPIYQFNVILRYAARLGEWSQYRWGIPPITTMESITLPQGGGFSYEWIHHWMDILSPEIIKFYCTGVMNTIPPGEIKSQSVRLYACLAIRRMRLIMEQEDFISREDYSSFRALLSGALDWDFSSSWISQWSLIDPLYRKESYCIDPPTTKEERKEFLNLFRQFAEIPSPYMVDPRHAPRVVISYGLINATDIFSIRERYISFWYSIETLRKNVFPTSDYTPFISRVDPSFRFEPKGEANHPFASLRDFQFPAIFTDKKFQGKSRGVLSRLRFW